MIELTWEPIARAVACTLEVERLNGRGAFLDENSLRRTVAEHFQAVTSAIVVPEYNHPDIPGNKRLDVAGFGPQRKKIEFAVESKWIKEGGGTRDWPLEVAEDIFRLEMLTQEMAQRNNRVLVVGGIRRRVDAGLLNKKKNYQGGRIAWIDALLPPVKASTAKTLKVRDCHAGFSDFFKTCATEVGALQLPISYQAQLKAHYRIDDSDSDVVEVYVWRINRVKKRQVFNP